MNVVLVVRIVQHRVEVNVLHFSDGATSPGHQRVRFDELLPLQQIGAQTLNVCAAIADEKLSVFRDRALMHPEHADFADERIDHHFEHCARTCFEGQASACIRRPQRFTLQELG